MIARKRLDWIRGPSKDRHSARVPGIPAGSRCFAVLARHESPWELALDGKTLGRSEASASWHAFELPSSSGGALELAFQKETERVLCDAYVLQDSLSEGDEELSPGSLLPLDVRYSIAINDETGEAVITPVLDMLSFGPATVFAALKVDGYELLPAARLPLEGGVSEARLRPVRVRRPRKWWPKGQAQAVTTSYKMELIIIQGEARLTDFRDLDVWSAGS